MASRPNLSTLLQTSALLVGLGGCGGKTADVVRPDAPTAAQAMGEIECAASERATTPLVVDWSSQQRLDLEVAMKSGTVALRYACDDVELLPDCTIPGAYAFVGVSKKEEVISVASADELQASFPVGAAKLAAEVAGESTLELAMVLVGKASSPWTSPSRAEFPDGCEAATHVVRAATLGAFSLARGSEGKVMTTAEAFGAGAGASSTSARGNLTRDGDLEACGTASSEASSAPEGCRSSIRLQLEPIAEAPSLPSGPPSGPPPVPMVACPAGSAMSEGVCVAASEPHVCAPDDESDCTTQCDADNLESCYHLGRLRIDWTPTGLSGNPKQTEARPLLKRACDGGVVESCVALGEVIQGEAAGAGLAAQRTALQAAEALWSSACEAGSGRACSHRAFLYSSAGPLPDPARHFPLTRRACDLGEGSGCRMQADAYLRGEGAPKKIETGYEVLERACQGADIASCRRLAVVNYTGTDQAISPVLQNLPIDKDAGIRFGLRACRLNPDAAGISRTIAFVSKPMAQQFDADMCSAGYQPLCR